ncbi:hypothetical protein N9046_08630 [Akkermansiaceae bacterium]|nr:hypothetical protein [Akkermansiaceae bacterium]
MKKYLTGLGLLWGLAVVVTIGVFIQFSGSQDSGSQDLGLQSDSGEGKIYFSRRDGQEKDTNPSSELAEESKEPKAPPAAKIDEEVEIPKIELTYFADSPKEVEKKHLTIAGETIEGIVKVTLKEGASLAPSVLIIHSAGVKKVTPSEVPLAFAKLWGYSDADVKELVSRITARQEKKMKAIAAREKEEQAALIAKVGPKPKVSAWDGSVTCVKTFVKSVANDPKSVDFDAFFNPILVETSSGPAWRCKVIYRARNGFGALVKEIGYALVRHDKVVEFTTE